MWFLFARWRMVVNMNLVLLLWYNIIFWFLLMCLTPKTICSMTTFLLWCITALLHSLECALAKRHTKFSTSQTMEHEIKKMEEVILNIKNTQILWPDKWRDLNTNPLPLLSPWIELLYSWAIFSGFLDCWNSIFCFRKMFPTFVLSENGVLDLKSSPFRSLPGCALATCLLFLSPVCLCSLAFPRFELTKVGSSSYLDAPTQQKGFPRHPSDKMQDGTQVRVSVSYRIYIGVYNICIP